MDGRWRWRSEHEEEQRGVTDVAGGLITRAGEQEARFLLMLKAGRANKSNSLMIPKETGKGDIPLNTTAVQAAGRAVFIIMLA